MQLNTSIEISRTIFGAPDSDFIRMRDKKSKTMKMGIMGADCEFPEYHQSIIDPKQTYYYGFQYDTMHEDYGELDYKQYSHKGIHISEYTKKQIESGKVKYIVVWKWFNNNVWKQLEEGVSVGYELCGMVDAVKALQQLDKKTHRFPYPLKATLCDIEDV